MACIASAMVSKASMVGGLYGGFGLAGGVFVAADDFGDFEEGAFGFWGIFEDIVEGQAGAWEVFAEDVVDGEGMGHGFDAGDVDLGDLGDVLEDGFELWGEFANLVVGEFETGELGDVADLFEGDFGVRHSYVAGGYRPAVGCVCNAREGGAQPPEEKKPTARGRGLIEVHVEGAVQAVVAAWGFT